MKPALYDVLATVWEKKVGGAPEAVNFLAYQWKELIANDADESQRTALTAAANAGDYNPLVKLLEEWEAEYGKYLASETHAAYERSQFRAGMSV